MAGDFSLKLWARGYKFDIVWEMAIMNYEKLLEHAYTKLPKKQTAKERFEMPVAEVLNNGNNTIIKNFAEISKEIRRDPRHIAKFLYKALASAGSIEGNTLVLQKKIHKHVVNDKLHSYIKNFVICKACGKADTYLAKDGRHFYVKCEACGAKHYV